MTTKHQPATPLPWRVQGFKGTDGHSFGHQNAVTGRTYMGANGESKQNAAYIAHVANAYPGAVAFAKSFVAWCDQINALRGPKERLPGMEAREREARALLRELGEQ